jgi:hypothetical protein
MYNHDIHRNTGFSSNEYQLRSKFTRIQEDSMGQRAVVLVVTMAMAAGSVCAQVPAPKQPFSAEYVYTMNGEPMQGMSPMKVAATTEALAVDFGPHGAIVQLRPGTALVTMLMHGDKTYMTSSMPYDSEDLEAYFFMVAPPQGYTAACEEERMECEKVGVEEVAGRAAEHWRIEDPEEGEIDSWIDVDLGILIKSTSAEGYGMEARNLSTAKPAESLFEVPAGYTEAGGEEW